MQKRKSTVCCSNLLARQRALCHINRRLRQLYALLTHLRSKSSTAYQRQQQQRPFRLAVDRTFNVKGSGLVITGTAHSGCVTTDEHLHHYPSGQSVRVRGIRTQDQESEPSRQRRALRAQHRWYGIGATATWRLVERNTTGSLSRCYSSYRSAKTFRARQTLDPSARVPCNPPLSGPDWHWPPANDSSQDKLVRVDLVLDEPLYCHRDDRLILRDHSLDTTLGGGQVIYAETIAQRRRQGVRRQQHIAAYALKSADDCLAALLQVGHYRPAAIS